MPDDDRDVQVQQLPVGEGEVALWTLQRPASFNALRRQTLEELHTLASAIHRGEQPATRAVVITGAGERAFCAGADLKERRSMDAEATLAMLDAFGAAFAAIDQLPLPTVAAINGVALGGGLELALCCDFRLVAAAAELGLPEVSLAVIPGAGGTQRLGRLLGEARAKQLILFSQRLAGEQALACGLVHALVPAGESVLEAALRFVAPLVDGPRLAIAAALQAIDASAVAALPSGLQAERQAYIGLLASRDRQEALAAFAEKRPPRFTGH